MAVIEVSEPDQWARCVTCRSRPADGARGPWVDLGTWEECPTEDIPGLRVFVHDRLLLCGDCLAAASEKLPTVSAAIAEAEQVKAQGQVELDKARALAESMRDVGDAVMARLDAAVPLDLEKLDKKALRAEAKRLGVEVGPGNHSEEKLIALIRGESVES